MGREIIYVFTTLCSGVSPGSFWQTKTEMKNRHNVISKVPISFNDLLDAKTKWAKEASYGAISECVITNFQKHEQELPESGGVNEADQ
jgi:hypothetical protein